MIIAFEMASVDISMEKINKLNKLKHEALCMTEVFVCALNSRELNCIEHYISNSKMSVVNGIAYHFCCSLYFPSYRRSAFACRLAYPTRGPRSTSVPRPLVIWPSKLFVISYSKLMFYLFQRICKKVWILISSAAYVQGQTPNVVVEWLTLLFCSREVPGSNFDSDWVS
jgi:hypothetical protein